MLPVHLVSALIPHYTPKITWDFTISTDNSESEVAQSCLTLCDLMDCSLPSSSVDGIFQAIVLEWIAISFSSFMYSSVCISAPIFQFIPAPPPPW